MKHERALLDTRTAPYKMGLSDTVILERFVGEIERLAMEETSGWQQLVGRGEQTLPKEKEKPHSGAGEENDAS